MRIASALCPYKHFGGLDDLLHCDGFHARVMGIANGISLARGTWKWVIKHSMLASVRGKIGAGGAEKGDRRPTLNHGHVGQARIHSDREGSPGHNGEAF
jgi:hypothetical protein